MKLLSRARWPLAENDAEARQARLPAPSMFAPGMPRRTPGTVRVRLTKLRPLSGSASNLLVGDRRAQLRGRGLHERRGCR